jgi:hypothetical protein
MQPHVHLIFLNTSSARPSLHKGKFISVTSSLMLSRDLQGSMLTSVKAYIQLIHRKWLLKQGKKKKATLPN